MTEFHIICGGELINKHSKDWQGRWSNPFDILPPIGSVIEYTTFNQGYDEGRGVVTLYRVEGYHFSTEEDYNNDYKKKICEIRVDRLWVKGRTC